MMGKILSHPRVVIHHFTCAGWLVVSDDAADVVSDSLLPTLHILASFAPIDLFFAMCLSTQLGAL